MFDNNKVNMFNHIHIEQIDSTNNELRRLISHEPIDTFTMLTAEYQTSGRGQVGNTWESEKGKNLLMSILMRPKQLDVRQQYMLSMSLSVAVVRALRPIVNNVEIKWPNDIYVDNKKLGGILIENMLKGIFIDYSIMGLGLNINQTKFISDAPNPVSIKNITNTDYSPQIIAENIQSEIVLAVNKVDNQQFEQIRNEYMSVLYRNDMQYYSYKDDSGQFMARIADIEPDGHIIMIDQDNVHRRYTFKEVEFII